MRLVSMDCPRCGGNLRIEGTKGYCTYCRATYMLDDEVQHIEFDNQRKAGYEYEQGRIQAQNELKAKQIEAYKQAHKGLSPIEYRKKMYKKQRWSFSKAFDYIIITFILMAVILAILIFI